MAGTVIRVECFCIGKVPLKAARLIDVTYESMMLGIASVRPGVTLGDIGYAIQSFAEGRRCSVVRDFCGHGIGKNISRRPKCFYIMGPPIRESHCMRECFFTIEPMINLGRFEVKNS